MKRNMNGYYDFENGDELFYKDKIATVVKNNDYWHVKVGNTIVYIGSSSEAQSIIDGKINCLWADLQLA